MDHKVSAETVAVQKQREVWITLTGVFQTLEEAFQTLEKRKEILPSIETLLHRDAQDENYAEAYAAWKQHLEQVLNSKEK